MAFEITLTLSISLSHWILNIESHSHSPCRVRIRIIISYCTVFCCLILRTRRLAANAACKKQRRDAKLLSASAAATSYSYSLRPVLLHLNAICHLPFAFRAMVFDVRGSCSFCCCTYSALRFQVQVPAPGLSLVPGHWQGVHLSWVALAALKKKKQTGHRQDPASASDNPGDQGGQ